MPPPESKPEVDRDPFFIGWNPMPQRYARFLAPVACALLVALAVGSAVLAWVQRSPGPGAWADHTTTFTGIVYAEPYAMIRVPGEPGVPPRTILLVNEGKFGAKDRVRSHDGKPVRVRGTLISRAGWQMLELADGDEGLRVAELPEAEQSALRFPPAKPLGPVTLRGEIVDSKCYLGAMKPGGGRTHKGCAVLCLKGGLPPVFVSRDEGDVLYLLVGADGGSLDPAYFDLAADTVRLSGRVEEWGGLRVLRVK
jgi:hypothetical protein